MDKFNMEPAHLEEDELQYELEIRDIEGLQTRRQKTDALRKRLAEETAGQIAKPIEISSDEDGYDYGIIRLTQLRQELKLMLLKRREDAVQLVISRLRHHVDRSYRACDDDRKRTTIDNLVHRILKTIEDPEAASSKADGSVRTRVSLENDRNVPGPSGLGKNIQAIINSEDETDDDANAERMAQLRLDHQKIGQQNQPQQTQFRPIVPREPSPIAIVGEASSNDMDASRNFSVTPVSKSAAINKWKIQFSGEEGTSLTDFLSQVDLYARAENITTGHLFNSIFYLLKGRALTWYRANYVSFRNYAELVAGMKREFLPLNYDFLIREEIQSRLQGTKESFASFMTNMEMLFQCLYPPMSMNEKMYIIQRNMLPQYSVSLAIVNIVSLEQLKTLCKQIDEAKVMEARRAGTQTITNPFEPSFRAPKEEKKKCYEIQAVQPEILQNKSFQTRHHTQNANVSNRRPQRGVLCWNCNQYGHKHFECNRPREKIYCWCCGRQGVKANECPRNHKSPNLELPSMQKNSLPPSGNGAADSDCA